MPWVGVRELMSAFDKAIADTDRAARQIVKTGSMLLVREARADFQGAHKKGLPHQGPPGSYPNVVTGMLRRSIQADPVVRFAPFEYRTRVAPSTVYGRAVELGYSPHHLPAYPYFQPAVERVKPQFQALAARTWAQYLQ